MGVVVLAVAAVVGLIAWAAAGEGSTSPDAADGAGHDGGTVGDRVCARHDQFAAVRTRHHDAVAAPSLPLAGMTVVLDPGHNRDNGQYPAEINRQVDAGGFPKACNTTGRRRTAACPKPL